MRARTAYIARTRLGQHQRRAADTPQCGMDGNDDRAQMHADERAADIDAERGLRAKILDHNMIGKAAGASVQNAPPACSHGSTQTSARPNRS